MLQNFSGIPRRQISFTRKNLYRRDNYTCQYCAQRKPTSLALLWRGIGELLVRNPSYKVLFGPVSISTRYSCM